MSLDSSANWRCRLESWWYRGRSTTHWQVFRSPVISAGAELLAERGWVHIGQSHYVGQRAASGRLLAELVQKVALGHWLTSDWLSDPIPARSGAYPLIISISQVACWHKAKSAKV